MRHKITWTNNPKPEQFPTIANDIVGMLDQNSPIRFLIDDGYVQLLEAMAKYGQTGNLITLPGGHLQFTNASVLSIPIPLKQDLIHLTFAEIAASQLLTAIRQFLIDNGIQDAALDGLLAVSGDSSTTRKSTHLNTAHPIFQSIAAKIPAILTEVVPRSSEPGGDAILGDAGIAAEMRELFESFLQEALYAALPPELVEILNSMDGYSFKDVYDRVPDSSFICDLDIGAMAEKLSLLRLLVSAITFLHGARFMIWTKSPSSAGSIIDDANYAGVDQPGPNGQRIPLSFRNVTDKTASNDEIWRRFNQILKEG